MVLVESAGYSRVVDPLGDANAVVRSIHAAVFAVSSILSARITASVVLSVGFAFLLNDR